LYAFIIDRKPKKRYPIAQFMFFLDKKSCLREQKILLHKGLENVYQ
jgi:hypothetical protein